jgi:hypothetical protein
MSKITCPRCGKYEDCLMGPVCDGCAAEGAVCTECCGAGELEGSECQPCNGYGFRPPAEEEES